MTALEPLHATPERTGIAGPLREILNQLATQADELAEAGDLDSLAYGLADLKPILADLRTLAQHIEGHVAELMPAKKHEVPGLGVIERRKGTDRKQWQTAELTAHLVHGSFAAMGLTPSDRILTADGELAGTVTEAVELVVETLTACAPFTPSMGWRVGALRDLGIEVDEWCTVTPGRVSVQFHGGDK